MPTTNLYTDEFYGDSADSYRSAKKYAEFLTKFYQPNTVVDVGCGRGAWLQAFKDAGAQECVGIDGEWNTQANMFNPEIKFQAQDLNQPITVDRRFDLAISVEVAEHLEPTSDFTFVDSLTLLSDVIVFGAAFIRQGGQHHIHEQYHTHWAQMFTSCGYQVFDCFRPAFWGDDEVCWWYQQNTFLYVKQERATDFIAQGLQPLTNRKFMNCVHPYLYAQKTDQ